MKNSWNEEEVSKIVFIFSCWNIFWKIENKKPMWNELISIKKKFWINSIN